MKKFLKLMLTSFLMIPCMFVISACGETEPPHVHAFGPWNVMHEATCKDDGQLERLCSCGEREFMPEPATGEHSYGDWMMVYPANCFTPGLESRNCHYCGESEVRTIPKSNEHTLYHSQGNPSTCNTQGVMEHWVCNICARYFRDASGLNEIEDKNVTLPFANHTISHHEEEPATCQSTGTKEYWECTKCYKIFANEGLTQVLDDMVIPMEAHIGVHHERIAPTCTTLGTIEYWQCSECEQLYFDEDCTQIVNISTEIEYEPHTMRYHAQVQSTCKDLGNYEHYTCDECSKYFWDEYGNSQINASEVVMDYANHDLSNHPYVDRTCTTDGNNEYYECSVCDKYFSDYYGDREIVDKTSVIIPKSHSLSPVTETNSSCVEHGHVAHYLCDRCDKTFSDNKGVSELNSVEKPLLAHDMDYNEYTAPTCYSDGNIEYWYCRTCYRPYEDAEGTRVITTGTSIDATHDFDLVETVDSTCTDTGVSAHNRCQGNCDGYFDLDEHSIEASTLVIALKNHEYVSGACKNCGYIEGATVGLAYELNEDEVSYSVVGIGTATNATNVVISSTYKNLPVTKIKADSFSGNTTIKKMWIPDSVIEVDWRAFTGTSFDEFSIPNTDAYTDADGKKTIIRGLNSEGSYAIYSSVVEELVLPDGLLEIVSIPTSVKKVTHTDSVVSIAANAFRGCSNLETIIIPTQMTKIYESTFEGCTKLANVVLHEGIVEIEEYAFYGCSAFTEIVIPSTVNIIGRYAFGNCTGAKSVKFTLQNTITLSIGASAFTGSTNILNVYANDLVRWSKVVFDDSHSNPTFASKSLTINGTKLGTTITIPSEITELLDYTFACLEDTVSIIIPATTRIIGDSFYGIGTNLESVTMPYYDGKGLSQIIHNPSSVKTLIINAGTEMDSGYQSSASNLESITIPATMQKLTYINFTEYNPKLTTLNIATVESWINTVVEINSGGMRNVVVKYNSNPVTSITLASDIVLPSSSGIKYLALTSATVPTQVVSQLPSSIQYITINGGENLYVGSFSNLKELTINDGLKYIDQIRQCDNLENIYLPATIEGIGNLDDVDNRLTKLNYNVYNHGMYLGTKQNPYLVLFDMVDYDYDFEGFEIHNDCKFIEGYRVSYYKYPVVDFVQDQYRIEYLEYEDGRRWVVSSTASEGAQVTLPENVVGILQSAFAQSNFTLVGLPESLKYIGDSAFSSSKLTGAVVVPDGVVYIGEYAFYNCTEMTEIKLPATLEKIGEATFYDCTKLKYIYLSLEDKPGSTKLPTSLKYIDDRAFYNCAVLTEMSLTLPSGLLEIGDSAFYGCLLLTNIVVPDTVVVMGSRVFEECVNLTNVTLSSSLISLGGGAFYNTKVTTITLPSGITDTSYIFTKSTELVSIVLPDTIKVINEEDFGSCTKFTTIYYAGTSEEWEDVTFYYNNAEFKESITVYYYSESEPESSGNYWYYIGNVVTKW